MIDKEKIRRLLEDELKKYGDDLNAIGSMKEVWEDVVVAKTDDEAAASRDADIHVATLSLRYHTIKRIVHALDELDRPGSKVGICRKCNGEIEPKRLKAVPHADLCLFCLEKIEEKAAEDAHVESKKRKVRRCSAYKNG